MLSKFKCKRFLVIPHYFISKTHGAKKNTVFSKKISSNSAWDELFSLALSKKKTMCFNQILKDVFTLSAHPL